MRVRGSVPKLELKNQVVWEKSKSDKQANQTQSRDPYPVGQVLFLRMGLVGICIR